VRLDTLSLTPPCTITAPVAVSAMAWSVMPMKSAKFEPAGEKTVLVP